MRTPTPFINVARFDLVSIRLVVLCAEQGSLGTASKMANMTKSSASHRLACFEAKLGKPLFIRDYRGLCPTEAGRVVAAQGRHILRSVEQLTDLLSALHGH